MISHILELVGECFNEMLLSTLIFGLPALLVGILLNYFLKKRTGFKIIKWLAIVYSVVIPLSLACLAGGAAALSKGKAFAAEQVHKTVLPLIKVTFPSYQLYLKFNKIELFSERTTVRQTIEEHLSFIQYHTIKKGMLEKIKVDAANKVVPNIAKCGLFEALHTGVPSLEIDRKISDYYKEALEFNIDELNKEQWQILEQVLNEKLDVMFKPYFKKLYLFAGLSFLLPFCHLLLYAFVSVRAKKN